MSKDLALVTHFIVFPAAIPEGAKPTDDATPGTGLKPCAPAARSTWAVAAAFEDKTVTTIANTPDSDRLHAMMARHFEVYTEAEGRLRVMWPGADGRGCATPLGHVDDVVAHLREKHGTNGDLTPLIDALARLDVPVPEVAPSL